MEKYIIPFTGLKNGLHEYEMEITNNFFESVENSVVSTGELTVYIDLLKKDDLLKFDIDIVGVIRVQCDRCLEDMEIEIDTTQVLFVEFREESSDITDVDQLQYLAYSETKIDLKQHIYEYIALNVPMQNIHPDDENGESTCNADMLEIIEGINTVEETKETDPRWDELKKLMQN